MTAKTSASETSRKDWIIQAFPMITNEIIYKGWPVIIGTSTWYAFTNDWTTNTLSAGDIFAGICVETADSTWITAGEQDVRVYRTGSFLLPISDTITQANVGDKVYINNTTDDSTFTITKDGGVDVLVWKIVEFVSANSAYVTLIPWNIAWTDWDLIGTNDISDAAITKAKLWYTVNTVSISWATSGTATVTAWSQILGWYVTAITWSERVKLVDISSTTLTVTLSGSDTATVKVVTIA